MSDMLPKAVVVRLGTEPWVDADLKWSESRPGETCTTRVPFPGELEDLRSRKSLQSWALQACKEEKEGELQILVFRTQVFGRARWPIVVGNGWVRGAVWNETGTEAGFCEWPMAEAFAEFYRGQQDSVPTFWPDLTSFVGEA